MAKKKCDQCKNEFEIAFRVRHLPLHYARKEWVFLCEDCLVEVKPNNSHYQYGGTWKG
ncbi:MAG: hypothetical protein ACPGC6_05470 [Flavobacteriaceae bacterium]